MVPKDPTPFKTRTKLLTVYEPQAQSIRSGGDPYPVQIEVNISDVCNQNCRWCINANVREQPCILDIDTPGVRNFFNDFKRLGGYAVVWSGGGEPTLHPKFAEALELVADAGLPQGLITHGAFKPKLISAISKHCAWVRISIDTYDAEDYARRRGTKPEVFERVKENAQLLAQHGTYVGLNMNVAEWNKDHIERLYDLACLLKVKYLQVRPTLNTPFPQGEVVSLSARDEQVGDFEYNI